MRFSRARISGSFVPIDLAFSILVLLIKTTNISEGEVCIFYRSGVTEVGNMAKTSNSNQEWNPTTTTTTTLLLYDNIGTLSVRER